MPGFSILLTLLATAAFAQQTAEISGVVRDDRGLPVSGARIAISNPATGSEVDCYTQGDGKYQAINLEPLPNYTAEASHPGYTNISRQGIALRPGTTLHLDFALSPRSSFQMPAQGTVGFIVMTVIIGALVTIIVTDPGKLLLQRLFRGCTWIWDKCYEILAPRFPTAVGLRGYRKRVLKSDLAKIEHPVGPGESDGLSLNLDRAFAPLAMMTGEGEERVDLFPFAATHNRFIILGGPGTGKTTLMKNLIVSHLKKDPHEKIGKLIPIFVLLREMSTSANTVEQALVAALAKFRFKKAEKFITSALENGRLLIVLDGLDEVGINRPAVSGQIRDFCHDDDLRDHPNRVVVTCRENSYRVRDLSDVIATVARVEPFSPQHMRTFLQGWPPYHGRVALRLYQQIQDDPQILDICRNPLLLTLLSGLYLAKEKFYLPTSRKAFYDTAIRELLVERPARKQQRQQFEEEKKIKILQKIALNRLETVKEDEDQELLSREKLFLYSQEELGSDLKESDFRTLLEELDTVNSIIKRDSEGAYVFGHRTFQEYLAAREANLRREEEQIVARFTERDDLNEVLCFYCALLKNIPTIEKILTVLKGSNHTLLAARCLLNVVETPSQFVITEIVDTLYNQLQERQIYAQELDILSSLATRSANAFDIARTRFASAVESVTKSSGSGSAGLVSALSSNPKLSMRLIPGMLQSDSTNRRIQATELLHNLGTDDALQQLVQIAASGKNPEREWACVWVSNLIQTRNTELRDMIDLFPERKPNPSEWPFDRFFPGRIAVPLITAIGNDEGLLSAVRNECILAAIRIRAATESRWRTHMWRNARFYFVLDSSLRHSARTIGTLFFTTTVLLLTMTLVGKVAANITQKTFLFELWPPHIIVGRTAPLTNLRRTALKISAQIRQGYPPAPMGIARILPWNWVPGPSVPGSANGALTTIDSLSGPNYYADLHGLNWEGLCRTLLQLKIERAAIDELAVVGKLASNSAPRPRWTILFISGGYSIFSLIMDALLVLFFVGLSFTFIQGMHRRDVLKRLRIRRLYFEMPIIYAIMLFPFVWDLDLGWQSSSKHWMYTIIAGIGGAIFAGRTATSRNEHSIQWSPNPYLRLIKELLPRSEDMDNEGTAEQLTAMRR